MKRKLRSVYLSVILHERFIAVRRGLAELRRQLTLKKHVVHVFLQIDDPYSYLLSHYLRFVMQRYKHVEFRFYLCQSLRGDFAPQPALQNEHALADCRMLAKELGVPFLDCAATPTVEYRRPLLDFLADEHDDEDFVKIFTTALRAYWRGDTEGVTQLIERGMPEQTSTNVLVGKHQLLLRKMGHYSCATMCYAGEWYWGVDRLHYLLERFAAYGLDRYSDETLELATLQKTLRVKLPERRPAKAVELPPLEFFHSFRSPYAYIALARIFEIADAFGLKLKVRPLLPAVKRGMAMPKNKLLYIVKDANREAKALNMPFGKFADPEGVGAERCIAAFYYAESQGKARKFIAAAGDAIWARAFDVATDEGMQIVAKRSGLEWPAVQQAIADDAWRDAAEANREALAASGLWGVPSFRIGELALWGQDRLWLLARRIEEMCHEGPGTGQ